MNIQNCPICQGKSEVVFSATILGKYKIDYFYCEICGFLQTEKPFWLDEAYSHAISDLDTGLVGRNLRVAKIFTCILYNLFSHEGRYVDVGGGHGLLTRLMRDIGFDYYWIDKYCDNLFARGFEATPMVLPVTALSSVEVFEHIHEPISFIQEYFEAFKTRTIIFTTVTFEGEPPPIDWWYYALDSGQHISFYQKRTLAYIARYLGCKYYFVVGDFHILTDNLLNETYLNIFKKDILINLAYYIITKWKIKSRTWQDHLYIKQESSKK